MPKNLYVYIIWLLGLFAFTFSQSGCDGSSSSEPSEEVQINFIPSPTPSIEPSTTPEPSSSPEPSPEPSMSPSPSPTFSPTPSPSPSATQVLRSPYKDHTIVVYNSNDPEAEEIADYYIQKRELVPESKCSVTFPLGHYATMATLYGARKKIVEQCICPRIPVNVRPSPCLLNSDQSSLDAIAAVSPITHMALIRGIPERLTETGFINKPTFTETDDAQEPALGHYLAHLIYKPNSALFEAAPNGKFYFKFASPEYRSNNGFDKTANRYQIPVSPAIHKQVVFGWIQAMTKERTFDLIDRTLEAEKNGITGLFTFGQKENAPYDSVGNILRFVTNSTNPACITPLASTSPTPWPTDGSCRTMGNADGLMLGAGTSNSITYAQSSTMEMPFPYVIPNAGIYLNQNAGPGDGAAQIGFNGNFYSLLSFRKNTQPCTALCKDSSDPETCRSLSKDYFHEIDTRCVGVAPGFIGMKLRSFPVQYYGFFPQRWGTVTTGGYEKVPPMIKLTDGYNDPRSSDTNYIRFGSGEGTDKVCELENGTMAPCPERVPIYMYGLWYSPTGFETESGNYRVKIRFRYRNGASPNGKLHVRLALYDGLMQNAIYPTLPDVSMDVQNTSWQTYEATAVAPSSQLPAVGTSSYYQLAFYSTFEDKLINSVDLDAVEIIDETVGVDGTQMIAGDIGGFANPGLFNLANGDYAANVIDRLGGIAWWGSGSHFATGGYGYGNLADFAGGFFAGRSLGESVNLGGGSESGAIYGDPLYSPAGVKIYLEDGSIQIGTNDQSGTFYTPSYQIFKNTPSTADHTIYIDAFQGRGNLEDARWALEACNGPLESWSCDAGNSWREIESGTGAVQHRQISSINTLFDLIPDQNVSQTVHLRLKVWNPLHSEDILYHFARFSFSIPTPPTVSYFTVNSQSGDFTAAAGSQIDLSWLTNNSNSCTISPSGLSTTTGFSYVTVTQTTTFTLTCTNDTGGVSTTTRTVNVLPPANIQISGSTTFGNVSVNQSAVLGLTLTNTGGLTAQGVSLNAVNSPFSLSGTCADSLAPGESCTVDLTFSPIALGIYSQNLQLGYQTGLETVLATQTLLGNGVSGAGTLEFSSNFDFTSIKVDGSRDLTVTIANVGTSQAQNISLQALTFPFSAKTNNCSETLDSGMSCSIVLSFQPDSVGSFTDTFGFIFDYASSSNYFSHQLTGQGVNAAVTGRFLFYNRSKFDGSTAGPSVLDDQAIATDKVPFFSGQKASFTNATGYSRGINGLMIDIVGLSPTAPITADDFIFKTGLTASSLATAPAPSSITLRDIGAGATRITIIWPDFSIVKKWLQITVKANTNTGLMAEDIFYFGNIAGETGVGNTAASLTNTTTDQLYIRGNPSLNTPITGTTDVDRNGITNANDEAFARYAFGVLSLITAP